MIIASPDPVSVLVLCGPAGVGKSTTAFEMSRQLADRDVAHVLLDSDELDRVHPWPPTGLASSELSRRNLRAFWANAAELGHTRLILVGVFADLAAESRWITVAIPGAVLSFVRLTGAETALRQRIRQREVGSRADDQWDRTAAQLRTMRALDPPEIRRVDTTALDVPTVAARALAEWCSPSCP